MSRKSTKTTTVANITLPVRKIDFTEATKEFRTLCRNFYTDFEKVAENREALRAEKTECEEHFDTRVNNAFDVSEPVDTDKELPAEYADLRNILEKYSVIQATGLLSKEDNDYLSALCDKWEKADAKIRNLKNPVPEKSLAVDAIYDLYKGCSTDMSENRDGYARKVKGFFESKGMTLTSYGWDVFNASIGFNVNNDKNFLETGKFFNPIKKSKFVERFYMFFCEGFVSADCFPKTKKARHADAEEQAPVAPQKVETPEEVHEKCADARAEISAQKLGTTESKPMDKMTVAELRTFIKKHDTTAKVSKLKKADLVAMATKFTTVAA